jgi:uncharacterized oligopeptide transporter (OPT) family protein
MNHLRLSFAAAGLILAVLCVALNNRMLGWCAVVFLTMSLILRLIQRKRESAKPGVNGSV